MLIVDGLKELKCGNNENEKCYGACDKYAGPEADKLAFFHEKPGEEAKDRCDRAIRIAGNCFIG